MNKKLIRLTESDLHRIVKESVNRIIKEAADIDAFDDDYEMYSDQFKPKEGSIEQRITEKLNNVNNLVYQAFEEFGNLVFEEGVKEEYPILQEYYDSLYSDFKKLMAKLKEIDPTQVISPYE